MLGGLVLESGVTNSNLYSMVEIIKANYHLRHTCKKERKFREVGRHYSLEITLLSITTGKMFPALHVEWFLRELELVLVNNEVPPLCSILLRNTAHRVP